ncbi:hypothetical protein NEOLEDRAFT_1174375 [Neolentinus lepideus HHB14362 ss-1]|uniref:Uncharacterized protein n=1 Tax=Neolentinus lepideus HHB14362 ss-1 TaxID=1314782 RepID=A0A165VQC4_9AGAM|nr:hypothetical protein NEOLEDRAFT_1174375 [Neolentinus lepideus HHB14362 ss-1]
MSHDSAEDETKVNQRYLSQYLSHLKHVRDHLSGNDGLQIPPSYFAPSSYWTSSEKEKFFHALCVHSRLRPDLIAAEIGSKTVADVCIYLGLLERTLLTSNEPRAERKAIMLAAEVSDEWITFEEEQAAAILFHEAMWEDIDKAAQREVECEEKRKDMRARRGEGRTGANERDREGERQRRELHDLWKAEQESVWERQDALTYLDYPRLNVLEAMLREDAENMDDPSENEAEIEKALPPQATPGPAVQSSICDEMIDPVLLAQSRSQTPVVATTQEEYPSADADGPDVPVPVDESAAPPPLHTSLSPGAPSDLPLPSSEDALKPSADTGPQHSPETRLLSQAPDEAMDVSLSPRSRRRYHKRLYMRRKRAMAAGTNVVEHVGKLKPGPKGGRSGKATKRASLDARPAESQEKDVPMGQNASSNVSAQLLREGEEPPILEPQAEALRSSHPSGKTLPYKFRGELAELGIDAAYLRENEMGLLHLSGLGKLMRLYGSLEPESEGSPAISGETIQFFHAHLVNFVREVVQHAIVSREQELQLKLHTKVWRVTDDQVVPRNVAHALELMGVRHTDKRTVFQILLDRYGVASDAKTKAMERWKKKKSDRAEQLKASRRQHRDEEVENGNSRDDEERGEGMDGPESRIPETVSPSLSSLHREVYAPTVRLPFGTSNPVSGPYPRQDSRSFSTPDADCLMPAETDEDALLAELHEEEQLDEVDQMMGEQYEERLWEKINLDSDAGGDSNSMDEGHGTSLRFKEPNPNSRIKSQVYVLDSD